MKGALTPHRQPQAKPRKRRPWIPILGLVALTLLVACAGTVGGSKTPDVSSERASDATSTAQPPTSTPTRSATATPTSTPVVYVVVAGDTLGKIAQQYEVTIEELAEWNGIEDVNVLAVGQELVVSGPAERLPTPTATSVPAVRTEEGHVFSVPGAAYMDGSDPEAQPPLTIMSINIWDQVPRTKVLCTLDHGAQVRILDTTYADDRHYFLVESQGCKGWVSEPFLSTVKREPVGDLVY